MHMYCSFAQERISMESINHINLRLHTNNGRTFVAHALSGALLNAID